MTESTNEPDKKGPTHPEPPLELDLESLTAHCTQLVDRQWREVEAFLESLPKTTDRESAIAILLKATGHTLAWFEASALLTIPDKVWAAELVVANRAGIDRERERVLTDPRARAYTIFSKGREPGSKGNESKS